MRTPKQKSLASVLPFPEMGRPDCLTGACALLFDEARREMDRAGVEYCATYRGMLTVIVLLIKRTQDEIDRMQAGEDVDFVEHCQCSEILEETCEKFYFDDEAQRRLIDFYRAENDAA